MSLVAFKDIYEGKERYNFKPGTVYGEKEKVVSNLIDLITLDFLAIMPVRCVVKSHDGLVV